MAVLRAPEDHAQKKSGHAAEQDRPDVVERREAWFDGQLDLDPHTLVFIDETGASTKMARLHGRAPRGQRLRASIPHGHWKTTTVTGALRLTGMTAPMVLDGPMTGEWFLAYTEQVLAPTLKPGDVVIMDNLPAHSRAFLKLFSLTSDEIVGRRLRDLDQGQWDVAALRELLEHVVPDSAAIRCLIPRFDGAILSLEWKEAVWDRYVMGAPRPRTPSEQQYSMSQASLATLSRELGINPKTVAKWRKRATVEDLKT